MGKACYRLTYFLEQQLLAAKHSEIKFTVTATGRTASPSLDCKKAQIKQARYWVRPKARLVLRKAAALFKWWNTMCPDD